MTFNAPTPPRPAEDPASNRPKITMPAEKEKESDISIKTFLEVAKIIIPAMVVYFTMQGRIDKLEYEIAHLKNSRDEHKIELKEIQKDNSARYRELDKKLDEIKEIVTGWKKKATV